MHDKEGTDVDEKSRWDGEMGDAGEDVEVSEAGWPLSEHPEDDRDLPGLEASGWRMTPELTRKFDDAVLAAKTRHGPTARVFETHDVIVTPLIDGFRVNADELLIGSEEIESLSVEAITARLFHEAMHVELNHPCRWSSLRRELEASAKEGRLPSRLNRPNGSPDWAALLWVWRLVADADANQHLMWCDEIAKSGGIRFGFDPLVGVPETGDGRTAEAVYMDLILDPDPTRMDAAIEFLKGKGYIVRERDGSETATPRGGNPL